MPDKAPVCPWCDTPKDGVSINGIRILENCGNQYGPKQKANFCPLCGRPLTEEAAMKRFEPMQKPLTECEMEAISKNENEHVFVVDGKGKEYIALVTLGVPAPNDGTFNYPCGVRFNAETWDADIMDGDFYGMRDIEGRPHQMGWIAFKRKPTDEERKAGKWCD